MERFVQITRLYKRRDISEAQTDGADPVMEWYMDLPHLLDLGDVLYVEKCLITDADCAMFVYKTNSEGILAKMKYKDACDLFLQYKSNEATKTFNIKNN